MVIFYSYVSLPEGRWRSSVTQSSWMTPTEYGLLVRCWSRGFQIFQVSRALDWCFKVQRVLLLAALRRKAYVDHMWDVYDTYMILYVQCSFLACNGLLNLYAWVGRAWTVWNMPMVSSGTHSFLPASNLPWLTNQSSIGLPADYLLLA